MSPLRGESYEERPRLPPASYAELVARMRPGAWSQGGFLGWNEDLDAVLRADARALAARGLDSHALAGVLEGLVRPAASQQNNEAQALDYRLFLQRSERFGWRRLIARLLFAVRMPRWLPLPDAALGYTKEYFQVFILQWRGFQVCPWDCDIDTSLASIDFIILNRQTAEYVAGPGLIVHLIREHGFFEGRGSAYRVSPVWVMRVLGLAKR